MLSFVVTVVQIETIDPNSKKTINLNLLLTCNYDIELEILSNTILLILISSSAATLLLGSVRVCVEPSK